MIGNEVSDSIAAEKNPRELVFTKLELSPVDLDSFIGELPLFPPISREPSGTMDMPDQEGVTLRKQKGCRCKQSKCMKLYCDCFASGVFCTDCDCADCHNSSKNCDIREAALMNVLDRYPNAFHRGGPSSLIGKQYEDAPATKRGLRSRGCKCKRIKCVKKYCECFQASALCSDICQCINCENVSEMIQHTVSAWGLNNNKSHEKPENSYNALGISSPNRDNTSGCMNKPPVAHSSPQVYQRRRYREQRELNSCPALLSSIPEDSILNALASPMSSSPKLPYRKKRSRLGYTTTRLPDSGELCSLLLDASESATTNAENTSVLEVQSGVEDQKGICKKPDDKEDKWSESESRNVVEEIQSCGRLIELIDAQYNEEEDPQCSHETDNNYIKQERAVLETFRDCLQKFIKIKFARGRSDSFKVES